MKRLAAAMILGLAFRGGMSQTGAQAEKSAAATITQAHLLEHIRELSSDAYSGRAPGTDGETKSVAYLIAHAKAIGLEPGNPDGSWTQTVKLWGMLPRGTLQLVAKGKPMPLVAGTDYVAYTSQPQAQVDVPPVELVLPTIRLFDIVVAPLAANTPPAWPPGAWFLVIVVLEIARLVLPALMPPPLPASW